MCNKHISHHNQASQIEISLGWLHIRLKKKRIANSRVISTGSSSILVNKNPAADICTFILCTEDSNAT